MDERDPDTPSWKALLQQSRDLRQQGEEHDENVITELTSNFPALHDQLGRYAAALQSSDESTWTGNIDDSQKEMIIETRGALRFALSCLSFQDEEIRQLVQRKATSELHIPLASILSQTAGDKKCRLMAARILSNLVTANSETASTIASSLPLSPSEELVASRILSSSSRLSPDFEANWVDMIIGCVRTRDREALAAVVAALHNCMVSLTNGEGQENVTFVHQVATSNMLISNLLRHIISADSIKQNMQYDGKKDEEDSKKDHDPAAEWITILLVKLCKLGKLQQLFVSAGGSNKGTSEDTKVTNILPEQMVLLHCLAKEIDEWAISTEAQSDEDAHILGGEMGQQTIMACHDFLASIYESLREHLCINGVSAAQQNYDAEIGDSEKQLCHAGVLIVIDMLGTSLGTDNTVSPILRLRLGSSGILVSISKDLGAIVDTMSKRSFGIKSRELTMSDAERHAVTSLVRLVGNLCFRCRRNQDTMRTIAVPNLEPPSEDVATIERTAIHVLLSTTSFAHACFTLREWALVAIRNMLEENDENQKVVADLEAQRPMEQAELNNAGVKVKLNAEGKVSVVPLDTVPESVHTEDLTKDGDKQS